MKKYSKFKTGSFSPQNKDKYKGTYPIIFRSSWEQKLMMYLDRCESCISWGSESTIVHYHFAGRNRRYMIDFSASFKNRDSKIQKYLIEVKPEKEKYPPKQTPNKKNITYLKELRAYQMNSAKWESAQAFAKTKGYKFIVLTEKNLFV
jgi:hypothetical protein